MNIKNERKRKVFNKIFAYILTVCMFCSGISFGNIEPVQAADKTVVYFYNSQSWGEVGAHAYVNDQSLTGEWNSTKAQQASDLGDKWYKLSVAAKPQFSIIFYNRAKDSERVELAIPDSRHVYVAMDNQAYTSKSDAEKSINENDGDSGKDNTDDGNTDNGNTEKNPDITDINFSGKGANLPYITYEAESASTNAKVLEKSTTYRTDIQSEASGRQAVRLEKDGDYVEFTLKEDADAMVLRYCIPDSSDGKGMDADISLYVNGTEKRNVALTSAYAWIYGDYPYNNTPSNKKPHRFFDEVRLIFDSTISAGSKIKLQKDSADKASYYIVDFIECEKREAEKKQPAGSLSVTEYGAKANDNKDDYDAFVSCINAAKSQNKEVWIPAGTFDLKEKRALDVDGVTIRGAGMWYTNLVGAGVSFHLKGTCKFHDFAMTGVSKIRDDAGDLAGFEPVGDAKNVTIENIWMEHIKVGIWSYNTTNLLVQGCRIRNTYADGMNMCSNSHHATIRNNNVRNTGDDGIAIWPWNGDCTNNLISHNTVQLPNLANGIALYAGNGNKVENNHVLDIVNNGSGICLGSEFDTEKGFSGTTTVSGNLLERCGSYQTDRNYPVGALWIWSTWHDMTATYNITDNKVLNSSYVAFGLDCNAKISGVNVSNLTIDGATDAIFVNDPKSESQGAETGEATFENVSVKNYTGKLVNNKLGNKFIIKQKGDGIYEAKDAIPDLDLFELEAEVATLSNDAKLETGSYEGISNGAYIGYIGGEKNGTAIFQIPAKAEGKRVLKIYYATAQDRSVGVQVNDNAVTEVKCTKTDDWHTICQEPVQTIVDLKAGENILKLTGYNGGDAPNIDRIEIGMSEEEAKAVVEALIADIPEELTTDAADKAIVHAVNSAYEKLSADVKDNVTGADALKAALEQVDGAGSTGGNQGNNGNQEQPPEDAETFTVRFDAKNETEITEQIVKKGEMMAEPADPIKEGYVFLGWYLDGKEYDFATPVETEIILIAEWKLSQAGDNTQPGNTSQPGDNTQPGNTTQPGDNIQPGNTTQPGDNPKPDGTSQPGDNTQPGNTTQPGDNPKPDGTSQPGDNTQPGNTTQPGDNIQPGNTTQPGDNPKPDGITQPEDIRVQDIIVTGISREIAAGKQISLSAEVLPVNATNKSIVWESSNTSYATVDANGVVQTKKAGKNKVVTITAKAGDGSGILKQYSIKLKEKSVKKITFVTTTKTIKAGQKLRIRTEITPDISKKKINTKLVWSSSNTKYATVNSKGVVKTKKTAKNKTVVITARSTDGSNKKCSIRLHIK